MQKIIPRVDINTLSEHREDDIMVSRFSEYLKVHHDLIFPHRHSFYHLIFFTKAAGTHTIDFHHFTAEPQQIYFMIPGQVHSWDFEGDVDGYVVNFSPTFFQSFLLQPEYLTAFSFLNGVTEASVIRVSDHIKNEIAALFEELVRCYNLDKTFREDMIRVLLLQIFIRIEQSEPPGRLRNLTRQKNATIRNFQQLVEKNYLTLRLPGEYAELLSVTPNHLNALSKEHLGTQAGEVVRGRVILEAKRLLINMDLSISQIADKLNFSDNSYFTRFFKKSENQTPEEFRQKSVLKSKHDN